MSAVIHLSPQLTKSEQAEYEQYESTITTGFKTFCDVGLALLRIRDKRLYRGDYPTWEAYCKNRWGFTGRRGNHLIAGAETYELISKAGTGVPNPQTEYQVRPLAGQPEAPSIWVEAVEQHGDSPTNKQVEEVKVKRQVYASRLAPVIEKMDTGQIKPKQALVLSDTLSGCEPQVLDDMLRLGVTDPAVIRKLNGMARRGSESYGEIVRTGWVQFTGEDDAIRIDKATIADLTRWLDERQREKILERAASNQPFQVTFYTGQLERSIKELRALNLPEYQVDLIVAAVAAL